MPYPLEPEIGTEIYKYIYDSWCIIGSPIAIVNPLGNGEPNPAGSVWDWFADDNGVIRYVRWLWSADNEIIKDIHITPVPCKIESTSPMPDINAGVWQNPLETAEFTVFCPPPTSDRDLGLCSENYSFIIKQFDEPKFPIDGDWDKPYKSEKVDNIDIISLMHAPGQKYSASAYPEVYPDHMEIKCYRG
jgi:hypothetical protein